MIAALLALGVTAFQSPVTAFTHVNVIPMDRERVLADQTVLIRDGRIAEIGDSLKVRVPAGTQSIDSNGKFLIPGLVDMHNHLFADKEDVPDDLAPDELRVMLANGVTTSRLMCGTPNQLAIRSRIQKGELLLPTIYVSSPQLVGTERWTRIEENTRLVRTAEEARQAVQDFKKEGYDFIKMTMDIKQPAYDAVMDECAKQGIRGIGHVDPSVGAIHAIDRGQQIEHLDSFLEAILKDDSPIKTSVTQQGLFRKENWNSLDHIDEEKLKAIAKKTAEKGIYVCPTLAFLKIIYGKQVTQAETRSWPDFRFMPKKLVNEWDRALGIIYPRIEASERHRQEFIRVRNELVRLIHAYGGKVMAGSDSPDVYLAYGFTMHRELRALVEAGLSAYAALEAATKTPAKFLRGENELGQIRKGLRADLVLLEGNPLTDIANTEHISGVMLRGHWFGKSALAKMLDDSAARIAVLN